MEAARSGSSDTKEQQAAHRKKIKSMSTKDKNEASSQLAKMFSNPKVLKLMKEKLGAGVQGSSEMVQMMERFGKMDPDALKGVVEESMSGRKPFRQRKLTKAELKNGETKPEFKYRTSLPDGLAGPAAAVGEDEEDEDEDEDEEQPASTTPSEEL